jgi:hypothetical protein
LPSTARGRTTPCWYSDANSPFRDLAVDKKREQCLTRAGIPKTHARYEAILAGTDKPVLQMIAEYVQMQDWLEYGVVFHGREHIWSLISTLSQPLTKDDLAEPEQKSIKGKNDNLTYALAMVGPLDNRWKALWMGDADVQQSVQQDSQKKKLSAEGWAESRKFIPKTEQL